LNEIIWKYTKEHLIEQTAIMAKNKSINVKGTEIGIYQGDESD
jgi:hypothetical protein